MGVAAEAATSICKKGAKNFFCMDCKQGPHCYTERQRDHAGHNILQVRRAPKEDAIKAEDIENVVDVQGIQEYSINKCRILFLPSRPQAKPTKSGAKCIWCKRSLPSSVLFCSLNCKRVHIVNNIETTPYTMRVPGLIDLGADDRLPGLTKAGNDSGSPVHSPKKRAKTSKAVSFRLSKDLFLPTMGAETRDNFRKRPRKGVPCRSPGLGIQDGFQPASLYF